MTREDFWCDVLKLAIVDNNMEVSLAWADESLQEYDKRFGKRPTSEYSVDDLPPFELLEDGVGISGVIFTRHYDQANRNFCIKTQKEDVIGGPYYSNTNNEGDFKRWWETLAGAVVKQAVEDLEDGV